MSKVSLLIPSRNERFLTQTVNDVLAKARGEIEVIVALDGYDTPLSDDVRVKVVRHPTALGLRACINHAASIATGDYLLKADAHIMFDWGFDTILSGECDEDWIVIPARYSLDPENWAIRDNGKSRVDAHYLSYPYPSDAKGAGLHGVQWNQRARERLNVLVDEEMSTQGSCYFMSRKHWDRLGGMDESLYGSFMGEPQELGLKTWLGGGRMMCNKRTWYSHLFKGRTYGRGYPFPHGEREKYSLIASQYWMTNSWPERVHDIQWLIERFWPVPTWPSDILENWGKYVPERVYAD